MVSRRKPFLLRFKIDCISAAPVPIRSQLIFFVYLLKHVSDFNQHRPLMAAKLNNSILNAEAGTELHNWGNANADGSNEITFAAPTGNDYFGCNLQRACAQDGYAVHVLDGSQWKFWTAGDFPTTYYRWEVSANIGPNIWTTPIPTTVASPHLTPITSFHNFMTRP